MTDKKPLISLNRNDFEWEYTKGTGAGGQKKNKTSNAVHCWHRPSGCQSFSQDGRSKEHNRQDAFSKIANNPKFKKWLKLEIAKKVGTLAEIEQEVDRQMNNIRIEGKDNNGRWAEIVE